MTSDTLPFPGGAPRRRRGVSRSQLDRTLLAWRTAGTLAGDEYAAARSALRDAAEAVDAARTALRDGTGSPYTLSMAVRIYAELIHSLGPAEGSADAELAGFLAGLGTPSRVSDAPDP